MSADLVGALRLVGIEPLPKWNDAMLLRILGDVLIERYEPSPEELLGLTDKIITRTRPHVAVHPPTMTGLDGMWLSVPGAPTKICIWRGDICTLSVDAVVNAANEEGLGCFAAPHKCIDNVLHRAAGPRLREACRAEMAARSPLKLTAGSPPLVTKAFHLPSRAVLHVTGPQVTSRAGPTPEQPGQLARCYRGCLDACKEHKLRSVAFPCISTGIFGYPAKEAAEIALASVRDWVRGSPDALDVIVFDVFTPADHDIYLSAAPRFFSHSLAEGKVPDVADDSLTTSQRDVATTDP